jgi:hypothetical protein
MGMLYRERRVTYRSLKYVFRLEDGLLEEVKEELLLTGRAWDEGGKVLVWTGETSPAVPQAVALPMQPPTAEARAVPSTAAYTLPSPATEADVRSNALIAPPRRRQQADSPTGPWPCQSLSVAPLTRIGDNSP